MSLYLSTPILIGRIGSSDISLVHVDIVGVTSGGWVIGGREPLRMDRHSLRLRKVSSERASMVAGPG